MKYQRGGGRRMGQKEGGECDKISRQGEGVCVEGLNPERGKGGRKGAETGEVGKGSGGKGVRMTEAETHRQDTDVGSGIKNECLTQ